MTRLWTTPARSRNSPRPPSGTAMSIATRNIVGRPNSSVHTAKPPAAAPAPTASAPRGQVSTQPAPSRSRRTASGNEFASESEAWPAVLPRRGIRSSARWTCGCYRSAIGRTSWPPRVRSDRLMAAKTGRAAIDTVSRRTERLVTTYLATERLPERGPVFACARTHRIVKRHWRMTLPMCAVWRYPQIDGYAQVRRGRSDCRRHLCG
jgi:hypothetical protein